MHSLRKACYTCVRCVLICENTVTCKTARGDPKSNARGDPKSNARGDPKSNARGDPKPNARGDPKSNARGDPKSNARGDPKSNAHVGPAGGVSRGRMCVQTIIFITFERRRKNRSRGGFRVVRNDQMVATTRFQTKRYKTCASLMMLMFSRCQE